MISRDHHHANCWLIGESIREIYQGVGCQYRPKDIIADIRNKFGVGISYGKTWRAREFVLSSIRGSPEESYSALPSYCYVLEHKNPDTITAIGHVDDLVVDLDRHNNIEKVVRKLFLMQAMADGEPRVRYNTSSTYEVEAINLMKYAHMSCSSLCSKYYTLNSLLSSYAESIYLPGHQRDWMIPDDISSRVVLPPKTRRLAGIPRNERILSGGESKHRWRCGRCGDYGHNRKSCKRHIPLHYQNDNSGHIEIGM
ncbi:hypothetical protein CK203_004545 [Vitis vinifera]|uniref:CCHC-type domain-containing protein n=1 Tax=Vitis vinifera TaxID=29760 RepID=A0A438KG64_VITVI|nr:hypothetical protein CK203_004545 [Vitis vinifera]